MGLYSFVLSACNGRFDARHAVMAGGSVMTAFCLLVSGGAMKARTVGDDGNLQLAMTTASYVTMPAEMFLPVEKPVLRTVAVTKAVREAEPVTVGVYKLSIFKGNGDFTDDLTQTQLSDLELDASVTAFSPKDKKACSVEAARAAAKGDTSQISPCIMDLLSGDEDRIAKMPENMAKFFIETMNDPDSAENAPKILINSMMTMMEAMTTKAEAPKDTSSVE